MSRYQIPRSHNVTVFAMLNAIEVWENLGDLDSLTYLNALVNTYSKCTAGMVYSKKKKRKENITVGDTLWIQTYLIIILSL